MKRLSIAALIFIGGIVVLLVPTFVSVYRAVSSERVTGFGLVLGSPAENLFRIIFLLILLFLAYWLSGKLVKI